MEAITFKHVHVLYLWALPIFVFIWIYLCWTSYYQWTGLEWTMSWIELQSFLHNYGIFIAWKSNFLMASSHIWDECMTSLKIRLVIKTWAYQCFSFHILLLYYTLFMNIKQISGSYIVKVKRYYKFHGMWHCLMANQ